MISSPHKRCFAEFILSEAKGLRMTQPNCVCYLLIRKEHAKVALRAHPDQRAARIEARGANRLSHFASGIIKG